MSQKFKRTATTYFERNADQSEHKIN